MVWIFLDNDFVSGLLRMSPYNYTHRWFVLKLELPDHTMPTCIDGAGFRITSCWQLKAIVKCWSVLVLFEYITDHWRGFYAA